MKTNYPRSSMKSFDFSATTPKKIFGPKWVAIMAAIFALVADVSSFVYLLMKGGGMRYATWPMILFILTAAFVAISVFTDYRFKYSILPMSLYIVLSSAVLILFLYLTMTNLMVTMTTFGYIVLILSHVLLYVSIVVTVYGSNRNTSEARSFGVKGILIIFVISVATIAYNVLFGFFGQGIGLFDEEMVLVYEYDDRTAGYEASDILYGRGNTVRIPAEFSGKKVTKVSCNIFLKSEIAYVEFDESSQFELSDKGLLENEVEEVPTIVASVEKMDSYRQLFFDYAKVSADASTALKLCNSVKCETDENKVVVKFDYDANSFPEIAKSVLTPTIILDKGATFTFADYADKIPFFKFISPKTEDELARAYTDGKGFFLVAPTTEDGKLFEGITLNEKEVYSSTLTFDRVYLIDMVNGNDEKYSVPEALGQTVALGQTFNGKFVVKNDVESYIEALPKRAGFDVAYSFENSAHVSASEFSAAGLIGALDAGNGSGTVTPNWVIKAPVINSFKTDKTGYTYGDASVVFSAMATSDLAIKYKFSDKSGVVLEGDATTYTIDNPIPKDSGEYTLEVYIQDPTTSLTANATKTINLDVAKKRINVVWTLPGTEELNAVYNTNPHPVSVVAALDAAVGADLLDVVHTVYLNSEPLVSHPVNAGTYFTSVKFADSANDELYTIINAERNFVIDKAPAFVSWDGASFEYDAASHGPSVTVTGVNGVQLSAFVETAPKKDAGSYVATFAFSDPLDTNNYKFDSNEFTFTINPKPITATWENVTSFVYNAAKQKPVVTVLTGICSGDSIPLDTLVYHGDQTNVGKYTVTLSLPASQINYTVTNNTCDYEITKKDLSFNLENVRKTYDGKVFPTTEYRVTPIGLEGADLISEVVTLAYGPAETAFNAGEYEIVLGTKAERSKFGNYNITYTTATLNIDKRDVTIAVSSAKKTYDGYVFKNFTVEADNVASSDKLSEIVRTFGYGEAAEAINVGEYLITLSCVAEGSKMANYNVTYHNEYLTVEKRDLVLTADNKSKTYDGMEFANPFTVTAAGLATTDKLEEIVSVNYGPVVYQINAGTYDIQPTTDTHAAKYGNYNITYKDGKYTINPMAISVTAENKTKVYDGHIFDKGFTYTSSALAEGDSIADIISAFTFGDAESAIDAGNYNITLAVKYEGAKYNNYAVTLRPATLSITKKPLTITAKDQNKIYDGTPLASDNFGIATYSDLATTDTIYEIISEFSYGSAVNAVSAGDHTITLNYKTAGEKFKNYQITYVNATLSIAKRDVSFSVESVDKVYDGKAVSFNVIPSGLADGDTLSSVISTFSYGEAANKKNVGTYEIALGMVSKGAKYDNYNVTSFSTSTLVITQRPLTVTAKSYEKIYDGKAYTNFGVTDDGLASTDTLTSVIASFGYGDYAPGAVNVGSYDIVLSVNTEGANYNNYAITFVDGTLVINKANLTIKVSNANMIYSGKTYNDTVGNFAYTVSGIVSGDKESDIFTPDFNYGTENAVNAGNYDIEIDPVRGEKYDNYNVTTVKGTLTIKPKAMTVTAVNKSKGYDGEAFSSDLFEYNVTGLVDGDYIYEVAEISFTCNGTENVGNYTITPYCSSEYSKYSNYTITYKNGTLSITKAELHISAVDAEKVYDGKTYADLTVTYDSSELKGGDTINSVIAKFSYGAAKNAVNVGTHSISLGVEQKGAKYDNYNIIYSNATLKITKRNLTVSVEDAEFVANGSTFKDFAVSADGLAENDRLSDVIAKVGYGDAESATEAGVYDIELSSVTNGSKYNNYNIEFETGSKLTITAAPEVEEPDANEDN